MGPLRPAESSGPQPLDVKLLTAWPIQSDPDGDKFARGTVLIVGGSVSTPGAAILAGRTALRAGAGRLQIATAPQVATAVAIALPESMAVPFTIDELRRLVPEADAVLIGPGLAPDSSTAELVGTVLELISGDSIVVVDAVAIQSAGDDMHGAVRRRLRGRIVLTPNRQELNELLGRDPSDHGGDPVGEAARRFGAVVTSFGMVRTADGRGWETTRGHPALGTSGSGDVLAGLITGIAARTGQADQATCWGTLLHALAGERLGQDAEPLGFLARQLIEELPAALRATAFVG